MPAEIAARIADVPPQVAKSITDAVEAFANDRNLEAVSWYHDEPVWFVRQRVPQEQTESGHWLVQRVQVAAFEPSSPRNLPRLYVLPDAYTYEIAKGEHEPPHVTNVKRVPLSDTPRSWNRVIEIYDVKDKWWPAYPWLYEKIYDDVLNALNSAWELVSHLGERPSG